MRDNDHESFYKYFQMTPERFDHLLSLVRPMLSKAKSLYREPISPDAFVCVVWFLDNIIIKCGVFIILFTDRCIVCGYI